MRKVRNDLKIQRKETVYSHCSGCTSYHFRNRFIYEDDNRLASKHGAAICDRYDDVSRASPETVETAVTKPVNNPWQRFQISRKLIQFPVRICLWSFWNLKVIQI